MKVEASFQNPSVNVSPHLISPRWETSRPDQSLCPWNAAWLGNSEHGTDGLPQCSDLQTLGLSLLCHLNCFQERNEGLKRNDFIEAQALVLSHTDPGQKPGPSQEGKRRWIFTF